MANAFIDGIYNVFNQVVNRRSSASQNIMTAQALPWEQMRAIYRSGIGSKIVRIKSGYALKDTLQFECEQDEDFYNQYLAKKVKQATKFMLGMGRGIIVIHKRGDDLSKPLPERIDMTEHKLDVFSGDMVTVGNVSFDLSNDRYMKPVFYQVRGHYIHYSRVVDFTYLEPPELDLPQYQYGGVSEFELVYNQIINDGVVERASGAILEKNSSWVYRIEGFKQAMAAKKDDDMVRYFSRIEDMRGMHGAVMIDKEDEVMELSQTLSNLSEVDQITLRRLAMVTGIPVSVLVGENVRGLNSTGENEQKIFQDMIETLQSDYMVEPINELAKIANIGKVEFRDNQGETPQGKANYDKVVIENALRLWQMGEDFGAYLNEKGVTDKQDWESFWGESDQGEQQALPPEVTLGELLGEETNQGR